MSEETDARLADPDVWRFQNGIDNGRVSLIEVRCRSCGRFLGVTPAERTLKVYCDETCAMDFPGVGDNEFRDGLISAIIEHTGVARIKVGTFFGISRQRVNQIVDAHKYRVVAK